MLSSNMVLIAFVTFIVVALIMHVPVWRAWWKKDAWVATDYAWLAIGLLGLLAASADVRK